MNMGDYIKELRKKTNLSQEELGKLLNPPINRAAINKWEKGRVENIKRSYVEQLALIFGVAPSQLMCFEDNTCNKSSISVHIPVLGDVAAGIPIDAIEDILDYEEIPAEMAEQGQFFGLRIKGDSMEPRICEGDVVIVQKQEDADSGDIVIDCINGDSATCKKLYKYPDQIVLMPLNNKYEPIIFTMEDVRNTPLTIIGKVVELRGKL